MHKSLLFSAALLAAVSAPSALTAQQQPPKAPPVPVPAAPAIPNTPTAKPDSLANPAAQPPVVKTDSAAGDVVPTDAAAAAIDAALEADAEISTFAAIAKASNLSEAIAKAGPVTLFVPSDSAFAKIPAEQREAIFADSTQLRALILSHVVQGRVGSADAATIGTAKNAAGADVVIVAADGKVTVGGAAVTKADLAAGESVIHVIDTVLLPATPAATVEPATPAVPPTTPTVPPTTPTVPPVQPDSGR